jgi:hypothetical protein
MLGDVPIYVKSGKQNIVTRSSTEADLVGISDSLSQVLRSREFLIYQHLNMSPVFLYQHNMSTIFLSEKGRSTRDILRSDSSLSITTLRQTKLFYDTYLQRKWLLIC